MDRSARKATAIVVTGLGVGALNMFVQGAYEVLKGGSFRDAAKEAVLTSLILGLGSAGAMAGALSLTEACGSGKALAKR